MGFLSTLTSLFSNNKKPEVAPVEESTEYKGFIITPSPINEGSQYRLSAAITKQLDDQLQTHTFIRSDVVANRDDCIEMTIRKAKIAIDQMGDSIFS